MTVKNEFKKTNSASFLVPEIRRALVDPVNAGSRVDLPVRNVALLSCDIAGFSSHTHRLLDESVDGIEALHRELQVHFEALVTTIIDHGGEPVTFIGDCLISVWDATDGDLGSAVLKAAGVAQHLADRRFQGAGTFDLNLHVTCGPLRTVEAGGLNDRWLSTQIGPALRDLRVVAQIRMPNSVVLSAKAAELCGSRAGVEPLPVSGAFRMTQTPAPRPLPRPVFAVPSAENWAAVVARIPRFVTLWIERVGLEWIAEMRPVTAVTVALQQFDDGEIDAAQKLDTIVRAVQEVIQGRDGSMDSVLVDEKGASILAFFGAPPGAHSDDPLRGVLSAREIVERLGRMSVDATVGVAQGRAFCGIVGTEERRSFLIAGEMIIISSRLAWAGLGGVLVDRNVFAATSDSVGYRDAPVEVTLKGQSHSEPAWTTIARVEYRGRVGATAGRVAEVGMLRRLWSETQDDQASNCSIIEGESGTGKTCLAVDHWSHVEASGGSFHIATATTLDRETPYSAIRRLITDQLGIVSGMSLSQRSTAVLHHLPEAFHDTAPLLDAVFPSGLSENALTGALEGKSRIEATESLLIDILKHSFGDRATCLCIDDAQWLDGASIHLLTRLLDEVPHMMLVMLVQPGPNQNWLDDLVNDGAHRVRLAPLDREGVAELIGRELHVRNVGRQLVDKVLQLAKGHPFFTAELLDSFKARGQLLLSDGVAELSLNAGEPGPEFPETLHGMILQRLDQAEPEQILTVRVASVAGLVFPTKIVAEIHPTETGRQQAHRHLLALSKLSIIEPVVAGDRPGYAFRLPIVRDVAYAQLRQNDRIVLHGQIARWLEANAGADRVNKLKEIADHWARAGHHDRAVDSLLEESLRLFRQGFVVEAVNVGIEAIRVSGVDVPEGNSARQAGIDAAVAAVNQLLAGRHPSELLAQMRPPSAELGLQLRALLSTAPFAFQSNQFEMFAWVTSVAMRRVAENASGPPHAFSMFSIVLGALTGDRTAGAAWSRAALAYDASMGGAALPAVGFIDTWFHAHWRDPLTESVARSRAAADRALADGDLQYASYNIAAEVVMRAALGQPLDDILTAAEMALRHPLHRTARVHIIVERQFARALRRETEHLRSFADADTDEVREIHWFYGSEFGNQIGYILSTRIRLHVHLGDFEQALALATDLAPAMPAIAGQTAEVEVVFHTCLARLGQWLAGTAPDDRETLRADMERVLEWRHINAENFGLKAAILQAVAEAIGGDRPAGAAKLGQLAGAGATHIWLGDRALALAFAARLDPDGPWRSLAAKAYSDWGAPALAELWSNA